MLKRKDKEMDLQIFELEELTQRGRNGSTESVILKFPGNHRLLTYKKEKKVLKRRDDRMNDLQLREL